MDEEGFSGRDGRTTIFDWWSPAFVRTLSEMIRNGSYRTPEADGFFSRFSSILRFAATDPAIVMGTTYDLCYCNFSSDGFDKDRHFVWLRDHEEETLLIAANFSGRDADMKIRIPEHAFEWLGMPFTESLNPDRTLRIHVPAMDGVVLRLCPDNELDSED